MNENLKALYDYQSNFLNHVTKDEDYAYKDQAHGNLKSEDIEKHLKIYKNNFYSGLINSITITFPASANSLPEKILKSLCVELIHSLKNETISSFSQVAKLFPDQLLKHHIQKKLPYIVDLADFELLETLFIKSADKKTFFKSEHPIKELKKAILTQTKLKFKKERFYHYKITKNNGHIRTDRISKALYEKETQNE